VVVEAVMSEQVCDVIPFGGVRVNKQLRSRNLPDLPAALGQPDYWVRRFDGGVFVTNVSSAGIELLVAGKHHPTEGYTLHTLWLSDASSVPDSHLLAEWAAEKCMQAIDGTDQVVIVANQVFDDWRAERNLNAA